MTKEQANVDLVKAAVAIVLAIGLGFVSLYLVFTPH